MTDAPVVEKKKMPKGGRKGGAVFPRYPLRDAVEWAKKLVSKTHSGPQPQDVVFSGVVGSRSGTGNIKVSALKQFGFLVGDSKAYGASDAAKAIAFAPPEELLPLMRDAALKPAVFKGLFNTFQDDIVGKPKLRQRAVELNVHPDEADTCVEVYVASLLPADLISVDGDKFIHKSLATTSAIPSAPTEEQADGPDMDNGHVEDPEHDVEIEPGEPVDEKQRRRSKSSANVSITVDFHP